LTGGISRKLHLHARRLKIDAPEGVKIDVTAELPSHFAESLATLGFELGAGDDLPPRTAPPAPGRSARAKPPSRRGERRSRSAPAKTRRK
jgi:23S rRNA pseudouridine955/2504/2580 synthase